VFSELPRDLNFLDHTSDIGWKAYARLHLDRFVSFGVG
jgi:hypothetical protein